MKKVLSLLVTIVLLFSLAACSGGIQGEEAKTHVNGFFDAVEAMNYELAATFLHPDLPYDLEKYFGNLEQEGLDFSDITIEKYTGFSSAYYSSEVDGSTYGLTMDVMASGEDIEVEIEIVKNEKGYGIYAIEIAP